MPQRAKTGSRRRKSGAPATDRAAATNARTNRFSDAFLANWIADRLGTSERRLILTLSVVGRTCHASADDMSSVTARKRIADHRGTLVRHTADTMVAAWGLEAIDVLDVDRVIAAARDLRATRWQPVVHAQFADVTNADDPADRAAALMVDHIAAAKTTHGPRKPDVILVTDSFKEICGPASHLRLFGTSAATGRAQQSLYALVDYQAAPRDTGGVLSEQAALDALGDLKAMLVAAAIIGPDFGLDDLARLIEMDPQRLAPALDAACTKGVLVGRRGIGGQRRYRFRDPALQALAYKRVPPRHRVRLHCRIAETLQANRRQAEATAPAQAARHHQLADDPVQAKRWLGKAAWRAITNEDAPQAIRHLRAALAHTGAAGKVRTADCPLLHLLGVQLATAEGNASQGVCEAHQRATQIPGQDLRALWLKQSILLVKGDIGAARRVGKRMLDCLDTDAHATRSVLGARILVHRMHGLSLMLSGQLQLALKHYDMSITRYQARRHGILRFAWGSDQAALAHAHSAWTHALTGDTSAMARSIQHARRACDRYDHAHTTAHAMSVIALAALMTGADDEAFLAAREARAIALEKRLPYWTAWNDVMLAAIDIKASPRTAYATLESAHRRYRATGAAQLTPLVHAVLSDAAVRAHHPAQALAHADTGLALVAGHGCALYKAELLHQRARALFELERDADAHEALRKGHSAAVRTGANLFRSKIEQTRRRHGR